MCLTAVQGTIRVLSEKRERGRILVVDQEEEPWT